jgi:hypothetical protein
LEKNLRNDDLYQNKSTLERFLFLCEGLIIKLEKLHHDSVSQVMKRKEVNEDREGNKKARRESSGYKALMIAKKKKDLQEGGGGGAPYAEMERACRRRSTSRSILRQENSGAS